MQHLHAHEKKLRARGPSPNDVILHLETWGKWSRLPSALSVLLWLSLWFFFLLPLRLSYLRTHTCSQPRAILQQSADSVWFTASCLVKTWRTLAARWLDVEQRPTPLCVSYQRDGNRGLELSKMKNYKWPIKIWTTLPNNNFNLWGEGEEGGLNQEHCDNMNFSVSYQ